MASSTETHEPENESGALPEDGAVFVDTSGRRRSLLRGLGWILTVSCVSFAATLVVVLAGGSSAAPWLPIATGQERTKKAEKAPEPALSASVGAPDQAAAGDPPAERYTGPGSGATPDGGVAADGAEVLALSSSKPEPEARTSSRPATDPTPQGEVPEAPIVEPAAPPVTRTPVEPSEETTPTPSTEPSTPSTPSAGPGEGTQSPSPDPSPDATPSEGIVGGVGEVLAGASELLTLS